MKAVTDPWDGNANALPGVSEMFWPKSQKSFLSFQCGSKNIDLLLLHLEC